MIIKIYNRYLWKINCIYYKRAFHIFLLNQLHIAEELRMTIKLFNSLLFCCGKFLLKNCHSQSKKEWQRSQAFISHFTLFWRKFEKNICLISKKEEWSKFQLDSQFLLHNCYFSWFIFFNIMILHRLYAHQYYIKIIIY